MTGAVCATLGGKTAATGSGSGIAAMAWNDVTARGVAFTNRETFAGFAGTITISATITGGALLYSNKGGVGTAPYNGPFTVQAGDTLSWGVQIPGDSGVSGTVSISYNGATPIDAFSYVLSWP